MFYKISSEFDLQQLPTFSFFPEWLLIVWIAHRCLGRRRPESECGVLEMRRGVCVQPGGVGQGWLQPGGCSLGGGLQPIDEASLPKPQVAAPSSSSSSLCLIFLSRRKNGTEQSSRGRWRREKVSLREMSTAWQSGSTFCIFLRKLF